MKVVSCFTILTSLVLIVTCSEDLWKDFKQKHAKTYKNLAEEQLRHSIFSANLRKIQKHNEKYKAGLVSYKMGTNQFTDMTNEELNSFFGIKVSKDFLENSHSEDYYIAPPNADIPKEIDWRVKGAVTPVKNQGACGSSWSFSVTGSLEGQYFMKTGKLVSLSEQNLIDCAGDSNATRSCSGGSIDTAYTYVKDYGLASEEDYPYMAHKNECRYNSSDLVIKIKDFARVDPNNEEALVAAVGLIGPISVVVDASNWVFYAEGIFEDSECSSSSVNHGVLAVGYGTTEEGQDYWIVKNSWGASFGENGLIRMKRGINQCGIAFDPIFPVL